MHLFLNFNFGFHWSCIALFGSVFSILLTARSTAHTNENTLPSPKIIHSSLLSSLDSCNITFVVLQGAGPLSSSNTDMSTLGGPSSLFFPVTLA